MSFGIINLLIYLLCALLRRTGYVVSVIVR